MTGRRRRHLMFLWLSRKGVWGKPLLAFPLRGRWREAPDEVSHKERFPPENNPFSPPYAFSAVMLTVISLASRQAASIFSVRGCTTISPGVRIIFLTEERVLPSAVTVR